VYVAAMGGSHPLAKRVEAGVWMLRQICTVCQTAPSTPPRHTS
jgi:hypothetical protein